MSGAAVLPASSPHVQADPRQPHFIFRARPVALIATGLDTAAPTKLFPANKERVALGIMNLSGAIAFVSHETPVKTTQRKSIPNGVEWVLDRPNGPQNALYIAGTVGGLIESWEIVRVFGDDFFSGQE